jgi:hypothetical protein
MCKLALHAGKIASVSTPVSLGNIGIMVTAWRRPQYLSQTLESWSRARGVSEVRQFTVALGWDAGQFPKMVETVEAAKRALGCPVRIKPDSSAARASRGMGRAIAEAISARFADPQVRYVVAAEEDVAVSSDAIEYMAWAASEFASDSRVLAVCAHTPAGQGWDEPGAGLRENPDADPDVVQLLPYFNPWVWGVWRDRWERVLRPRWDFECDSGGPMDSGYDHHVHRRIIPAGGYVCAVPLASRSQNIGRDGGWAADPAQFEATQSASFKAEREPCAYRIAAEKAQAA